MSPCGLCLTQKNEPLLGSNRKYIIANIKQNTSTTNAGVRQFMFTLNLKNGKGQKLRRNIKIHRGLILLNFHFPKNENIHVLIFGLMEITGNP